MPAETAYTAAADQANMFLGAFTAAVKTRLADNDFNSARTLAATTASLTDGPHSRDGLAAVLAAALVRLAEQESRP